MMGLAHWYNSGNTGKLCVEYVTDEVSEGLGLFPVVDVHTVHGPV